MPTTIENAGENAGRGQPERRSPDGHAILSTTPERQAVTGHNVRYVLGVSTIVAVVVLAVAWLIFFAG